MGRTVITEDGRFEWDDDKNRLNRKVHGFTFDEILEVFDDPAFLEGYDWEHSKREDRYYGIGCINNILYVIVFYTLRNLPPQYKNIRDEWPEVSEKAPSYMPERKRIISARQADSDEQEEYNDYFKKIKS
jgi:uncharacterized DUF497 family protein